MRCADGNALAASGAAAAEHGCTSFGLHARPEPVSFHTVAAVRLKSTLGHVTRSCFSRKIFVLATLKIISEGERGIQRTKNASQCGNPRVRSGAS
jgi:hypothetical protein